MDTFISDYDKACEKLGISNELPDTSKMTEKEKTRAIAGHKLDKIIEANNGDWKPDLADTDQWKYYPWFRIIKDKERPLGFRLSFYGTVYDLADAYLGCRHACKDGELVEFMGENCTSLYEDYLA